MEGGPREAGREGSGGEALDGEGGGGEGWEEPRPKSQEREGVRRGRRGSRWNEAWRVLCASVLKMLQDPEQVGSAVGFRVCWKPPSPSPRGNKATPRPVVTKASAKF